MNQTYALCACLHGNPAQGSVLMPDETYGMVHYCAVCAAIKIESAIVVTGRYDATLPDSLDFASCDHPRGSRESCSICYHAVTAHLVTAWTLQRSQDSAESKRIGNKIRQFLRALKRRLGTPSIFYRKQD